MYQRSSPDRNGQGIDRVTVKQEKPDTRYEKESHGR